MDKKRIITFVFNNCKNDARVLKESKSLVDAGYDVSIYALLDKETEPYEERDGIKIHRIFRNPIHLWIVRLLSFSFIARCLRFVLSLFGWKDSKSKGLDNHKSGTGFLETIKTRTNHLIQFLVTNKIHLIIYGWILLIIYFIAKAGFVIIRATARICKKYLRNILMTFHRPLSFLDYYLKAYKILKDQDADFYHCNDLNTLPLGYWLKRRNGGKLIYDSHELYIERNRYRKQAWWYKKLQLKLEGFLCKQCDGVITVGECIAEYMAELYKVKKPVVVMNAPSKAKLKLNSQGNEIVDVRSVLGVSPTKKLLLYTGAITFNRGIESLIRSMKLLPGYHLLLLGYGKEDYLESLKSIAIESKVSERFSFYGPVPHHEVTSITKQADLGIAPIENVCLSYYYCAPNKVFEYLLGGIPVIGSDFPELKKIIEGFEVGGTFDPEDPKDIARSVKYIFENEKRYNQMKNNTLKAAVNYNWETEAEKLVNVYKTA